MINNWLNQIGNTPLVKLSKLFANDRGIQVYAKLEMMNPNGSAKDRPAARIIKSALDQELIGPGSVVIESSSGNMAISLAAICSYLGMRFISVIDPRTAAPNIHIMEAFGAEISFVDEPDAATGEFLPARLHRVQQLLNNIPNSYWPNQYSNENNHLAHYEGTMREIAEALPQLEYIIGSVSTCGTMLGCANYIRDNNLHARVIAVDAAGSVIFGGDKGKRRFPGLGAGIVPPFGQTRFMDRSIQVSDWDMVIGCRDLVRHEAILAGPSSGAVIAALRSIVSDLPDDSTCVVIMHDRGERYIDTVYNDAWIEKQFDRKIPTERG